MTDPLTDILSSVPPGWAIWLLIARALWSLGARGYTAAVEGGGVVAIWRRFLFGNKQQTRK